MNREVELHEKGTKLFLKCFSFKSHQHYIPALFTVSAITKQHNALHVLSTEYILEVINVKMSRDQIIDGLREVFYHFTLTVLFPYMGEVLFSNIGTLDILSIPPATIIYCND